MSTVEEVWVESVLTQSITFISTLNISIEFSSDLIQGVKTDSILTKAP